KLSFRNGPKDQTAGAQLRTGESRDSGFDASHRPGMTVDGISRLTTTNTMMSEVSVSPAGNVQPPAPRWTPCSCRGTGDGRTGTWQMSYGYSRQVLPEENHAIRATLRMLARVHAGITCQRASM